MPRENSFQSQFDSNCDTHLQEIITGGCEMTAYAQLYGEQRNDITAAAARQAGERDTFARTTTADGGYPYHIADSLIGT